TACARNKAWQEAGFPAMRVTVNISARQFQHESLVELFSLVLKESGLDPHYLQLEITEDTLMQDADFTITMRQDLRPLGVEISIDDFGTGYSSLNYLRRFPIDVVKIDRSFVRDVTVDADDAAIVTAIIALAQSLKLRAVAEGVETQEQLAFLKERQCHEMQGYLFSKPVPAEAFERILAQDKRLQAQSGTKVMSYPSRGR
ncbi:MAG: EAL domain-containing protein, partial [Chloroflexota bacterium]|nr:EAL domain-containing protein [Chloroflexota bacterium]